MSEKKKTINESATESNLALSRISVSGFRSLREVKDFELGPINVLIGPNGAGKTNFIEVFSLTQNVLNNRLKSFVNEKGGAENLLYFGSKETSCIQINFTFGTNTFSFELHPSEGDELYPENVVCTFHGKGYPNPYKVRITSGRSELKLDREAEYSPVAGKIMEKMDKWRVYHFHDTSSSAKIKKTGVVDDNVFLQPDGENIAAFLLRLKEESNITYRRIVETVQLAAPFFDNFVLQPSGKEKNYIRLRWRHINSSNTFGPESLSDGTLRFICLTTLLLQPEPPSLIILDEPELGLHPSAINILADLLKGAATRTQVIVSTQSVTLVDCFNLEDIVIVDRKKNESVLLRPKKKALKEWLEEYSLGEVWQKNLLGGRP